MLLSYDYDVFLTVWSAPMVYSVWLQLETLYCARIPAGSDIYRVCAYTELQTVQRVFSAVYGTVYYKEPLESFDKSRAYM